MTVSAYLSTVRLRAARAINQSSRDKRNIGAPPSPDDTAIVPPPHQLPAALSVRLRRHSDAARPRALRFPIRGGCCTVTAEAATPQEFQFSYHFIYDICKII